MEGLIQFLFTGKLDLDNFDILQLLEMMNLAQFMFLSNLFKDLESYIEEKLFKLVSTADIAFRGLSLIYKFNFIQFKSSFLSKTASILDLGDNWKTDGGAAFLLLTSNIVKDIMDWPASSQIAKLKAFVFWFNGSFASCTADEKELILQSFFDLDKFTAKELVDYVRKTEFYADEVKLRLEPA